MIDFHSTQRDPFYRFARLFRRDLDDSKPEERVGRIASVLATVGSTPLALAGLAWLILVTDWQVFVERWPMLLLIAVLFYALRQLPFYFIADLGSGGGAYGNAVRTLEGAAKWSGILLFGPPVLWIDFILSILLLLADRTFWRDRDSRWGLAHNIGFTTAISCLFQLISLTVYRSLGGVIPIPGLELRWLLAGLAAVSLQLVLEAALLYALYLSYTIWAVRDSLGPSLLRSLPFLLALSLGVPFLANFFGVPLAGIYSADGLTAYLTLMAAVLLVAFLARQMSRANENARRQSIQLEKLEALGRAILNAPPDASALPALLAEHVPAMFTFSRLGIWVGEDGLFVHPSDWPRPDQEIVRDWVSRQEKARGFTVKQTLPWTISGPRNPVVTAPVLDAESGQPIGGIYVELAALGQTWDRRALQNLLPSLQGLAAQVASALHQAKVYARTLAHQKTQMELATARQIQTSFLPRELPQVSGWQIAASLEPAREMAGDFYDLIPLPDGRLGILIADVADKGVGPALYMALSRTLIRTFAVQYQDRPDRVLRSANERIIQDADYGLFVTTFYGVLDPGTGELVYANAGHNPPWVFEPGRADPIPLPRTGMALGVDESADWKTASVRLAPGSSAFFYTDGATDAQDTAGELLEEDRLLATVQAARSRPAADLLAGVVAAIRKHIGEAPQFDDITLVVLKRE